MVGVRIMQVIMGESDGKDGIKMVPKKLESRCRCFVVALSLLLVGLLVVGLLLGVIAAVARRMLLALFLVSRSVLQYTMVEGAVVLKNLNGSRQPFRDSEQ